MTVAQQKANYWSDYEGLVVDIQTGSYCWLQDEEIWKGKAIIDGDIVRAASLANIGNTQNNTVSETQTGFYRPKVQIYPLTNQKLESMEWNKRLLLGGLIDCTTQGGLRRLTDVMYKGI